MEPRRYKVYNIIYSTRDTKEQEAQVSAKTPKKASSLLERHLKREDTTIKTKDILEHMQTFGYKAHSIAFTGKTSNREKVIYAKKPGF